MVKTKTFFAHPIAKPPAIALELKNFNSILQKKLVISDKNGKSAPSWLLLCLGRYMTCGNKHFAEFPDCFETQCWQPCTMNIVALQLKGRKSVHIFIVLKPFTVSYTSIKSTSWLL